MPYSQMAKAHRHTLMLVLLVLCSNPGLAAEEPTTYDRISLSASASAPVENDKLVVVLYSQREGSEVAALTDTVNRNIKWGIDRARQVTSVKVQTLDYETVPVYRDRVLSGWRVRQSLRLESEDAPGLSDLLGQLQERLSIRSVGYELSEQRRKEAEDSLVTEAIAAFKDRATLVTRQLGRPGYRLVSMDVNAGGRIPRPLAMSARTMEMAATPPALEAGTVSLRVTVSGTIELKLE